MNMNKLQAGYGEGISGPTALLSSAAAAFNDSNKKAGVGNEIAVYPVIFEDSSAVAFSLSYCFNNTADVALIVKKSLKVQAEEMVKIYNHGLLSYERLDNTQKKKLVKIFLTNKDVNPMLIKELLSNEGIGWEEEVCQLSCMQIGRGRVNPENGFVAVLVSDYENLSKGASPAFANDWKSLYRLLETRGLLHC